MSGVALLRRSPRRERGTFGRKGRGICDLVGRQGVPALDTYPQPRKVPVIFREAVSPSKTPGAEAEGAAGRGSRPERGLAAPDEGLAAPDEELAARRWARGRNGTVKVPE